MTPYTLLCDNLGDLWKLWPDGRCCPIDDEDDLRDAKKIDELEPSRDSLKRLLKAKDGELITWIDCDSCAGTGQHEGMCVWSRSWNEDAGSYESVVERRHEYGEALRAGEFTDHGTVSCPDCNGFGRVSHWTGERVLIEALVKPERAA